jgi:hypothetical protein
LLSIPDLQVTHCDLGSSINLKGSPDSGMRIGKKPKRNKIAFDVLNAKKLMQIL